MYFAHLWLMRSGPRSAGSYVPVLGGALELVMVYLVWAAALEALRTARPLVSEPGLWLGLFLGLIPPAVSFSAMLFAGEALF